MERITKEKFFMVKPFFITALLLLIGLPVLSNDQIIRGKTVTANESMIVTRHYLASEIGNQILFLFLLNIVTILLSYLLFPYLWRD